MKCIASQLSYQVDFTRYNEHLVDITLSFYPVCNQHKLWLPTWIAGSYLLREFSKNITKVSYTQNHVSKTAEKISKNQWELTDLIQNTMVTIHYEVYCRDLSVRTAFVDNQRIFGNFTSLLLMVEGLENNLADISLFIPENFCQNHPNLQIATGLGYQKQDVLEGVMIKFLPICAFESYDYPFEIGTQTFFDFYTTKYPHHFYGTGDTLAALTTACILQDMSVEEALSFTLKFIDEVLQLSSQQPERIPFGLPIEKKLGMLTTKFTTEVSL